MTNHNRKDYEKKKKKKEKAMKKNICIYSLPGFSGKYINIYD